jgi:hypothetical protein
LPWDDSAGPREHGTATARKNARCISSHARIDFYAQSISTLPLNDSIGIVIL